MMRMKFAALAAAAVMASSFSAEALTYGVIPAPGGTQTNEALAPLGFSNPLGGWYGAQLYLIGGPADIDVQILGYEAANLNTFTFGQSFTSAGGTAFPPNPISGVGPTSWTVEDVASGLLDFLFSTSAGGVVENDVFNPDNTVPAASPGVNFFVSFIDPLTDVAGQISPSFGQFVYLFFDDDGANNDDNHDDLVVKLSLKSGYIGVVPVPAAGFLLIGALGVLGALRRRKA